MFTFHINYQAKNDYDTDVQEAYLEFLVRPCNNDTQQVIWEKHSNSALANAFDSKNTFGYERICFRLAGPFKTFSFVYDCKVQKNADGYIPIRNDFVSLEDEQQILFSDVFQIDHALFTRQTRLTEFSLAWVPDNMRYHRNMYLLDYVQRLNQMIHQHILYTPKVTTVYTTAAEIWNTPAGVCQDYSHLMLGILRSQHIPARYVAGYLNQGTQLRGAAQMHAWIEVYLPNHGWVGLDPTHNLWADHHYIKVADGQDYEDCSPMKGHITPSGINYTDHSVEVIDQ